MRKTLERLGVIVVIANDGMEAVEAIKSSGFSFYDLIFMDCQMPRMDGYQASREIRMLQSAGFRTPIIALTANAFPEDRHRCLAAGMDGYLSKPVDLLQLQNILATYLPPVPAGSPSVSPSFENLSALISSPPHDAHTAPPPAMIQT